MEKEIINKLKSIKVKNYNNGPIDNAVLFNPYGKLSNEEIKKTNAYNGLEGKMKKGWSLEQVWHNTKLMPVEFIN